MTYYFVVAAQASDATERSRPYVYFGDALECAGAKLSNGTATAWIVDRDGNMVLPAEQVRLRLGIPLPRETDAPGAQPIQATSQLSRTALSGFRFRSKASAGA